MRKGTRYNINIFTPINEAACKMMSLRTQGMTVQDYLLADETVMFKEEMGEDISPEGKAILSFMDENKRSTKKISAFLTGMADVVNSYGNPNQTTSSTRRRTSNGYRTEEINSGEKPAEAVKETKKAPAKLAEGYNTESGNDLNAAGAKEFIIKPDGSKDFGEITKDILIRIRTIESLW